MYDEGRAMVRATRAKYAIPPPRPGLPIFVLTSGENLQEPETGAIWRELQDEQARLSTVTRHEVVDGASHFIQTDAPDRVAAAIEWVLSRPE